MSSVQPVLAVTCLAFEAIIAAGPQISVLYGNAKQQGAQLESLLQAGGRGIISIGIAGGLDPDLKPGNWVVASSIVTCDQRFPSDPCWSQRLFDALPGAFVADIAGVDAPVTDPEAKHALRVNTGAAAVDMESHIAAQVAATHHVPFASCRVIIDPANRTVPPAALVGLRHDGETDIRAVLAHLVRHPTQLLPLLQIVSDARVAVAALIDGRKRIGEGLGFPYIADNERTQARQNVRTMSPSVSVSCGSAIKAAHA